MWVLCSEADYVLYYIQVTGNLQFVVDYFGYMLRIGYNKRVKRAKGEREESWPKKQRWE